MADIFEIAGRIHSTSQEKVAVVADEVLDTNKNNKKQSQINAETDTALSNRYTKAETYNKTQLDNMITTPEIAYKDYDTYADMVAETNHPAGAIYRVANYDGTQAVTNKYAEYSWDGTQYKLMAVRDHGIDDEPTAGSDNMVKSGGVQNELALGAVYDVSAKNPTAGPNNDGKWESLSALLSDANLNTLIPTSVRKGGMSIKFIQSSDNKYVQTRCMAQKFTTDVTQWQGVDEELVSDSRNLITSGAVESYVNKLYAVNDILNYSTKYYKHQHPRVKNGKVEFDGNDRIDTLRFNVNVIDSLFVEDAPTNNTPPYYGITFTDAEDNVLSHEDSEINISSDSFPTGAVYVYVTSRTINASTKVYSKIIINGQPITFNAINKVFDNQFSERTETEKAVSNDKFVLSKNVYPIYMLNTLLSFGSLAYPGKSAGVNNDVFNLLDNQRLDVIRLDASKVSSLLVKDAAAGGGTGSIYKGIVITDSSLNILAQYDTNCDLTTLPTDSAYIYVTIRNKNAPTYNPTKIVVNDYPFNAEACIEVVKKSLPSLLGGINEKIAPLYSLNHILRFAEYREKQIASITSNKVVLTSNNNIDVLILNTNVISSIYVSNLIFNSSGSYYGITLTDSSNNVIDKWQSTAAINSSQLVGVSKVYIHIRRSTASSATQAEIILINGLPLTLKSFENVFDIGNEILNYKGQTISSSVDITITHNKDWGAQPIQLCISSKYTGSQPSISFYLLRSDNVRKHLFVANIGKSYDFSTNIFYLPPIFENYDSIHCIITLASGATLSIKDVTISSSDIARNESPIKMQAHLGFYIIETSNSIKSFEYAGMSGFTGCICNPNSDADGEIWCYHAGNQTLVNAENQVISINMGITNTADIQALTQKNEKFTGYPVPTFDDYCRICALFGMNATLSMDYVNSQYYTKMKETLAKYGLLKGLTIKDGGADATGITNAINSLLDLYAVFGDDVTYELYGEVCTSAGVYSNSVIDSFYSANFGNARKIIEPYISSLNVLTDAEKKEWCDYAISKGMQLSLIQSNYEMDFEKFIKLGFIEFTSDTLAKMWYFN